MATFATPLKKSGWGQTTKLKRSRRQRSRGVIENRRRHAVHVRRLGTTRAEWTVEQILLYVGRERQPRNRNACGVRLNRAHSTHHHADEILRKTWWVANLMSHSWEVRFVEPLNGHNSWFARCESRCCRTILKLRGGHGRHESQGHRPFVWQGDSGGGL